MVLAGGHPCSGSPSAMARRFWMNCVASTPPGLVGSLDTTAVTSNVVPALMAPMALTMLSLNPVPLSISKFRRHVPFGPSGALAAPLTPVQHIPFPHAPPNAVTGTLLFERSESVLG